ncbi:MAG: hypothetical protein Q7S74_01090 [Nanoarchaeota archaeon]|nr:hypothetical protein [Nanoarchaeota archaeon]
MHGSANPEPLSITKTYNTIATNKSNKNSIIDYVKEGASVLSGKAASYVSTRVKEEVGAFIDRIEQRIITIEERLLRNLLAMIIISSSIIFLALAVFFFMAEYLKLTNTISFLIVGIILLLVGIIIKGGKNK